MENEKINTEQVEETKQNLPQNECDTIINPEEKEAPASEQAEVQESAE